MNNEKQIEEMAEIIDDNHGFIVSSVETAESLYNAGYRKSTEVAEKIFAEIGTSLVIGGFVNGEKYLAIREDDYNHYKKKYTEENNVQKN